MNTPTLALPRTRGRGETQAAYPIRDVVPGPCPICKGLRFVAVDAEPGDPQFGRLEPCACYRDEMMAKRQARLTSASDLVGDLLQRSFENFVIKRPAQQSALAAARAFVDRPEGWLLIHGDNYQGKTHLAAAIANARIAAGQPALFVVVAEMLDYLRDAFSPQVGETYSERFEMVKGAPCLILDDLGAENQKPWVMEKLFQLLNHRIVERLPTVITTNVSPKRFEAHFGRRIAARLTDPMVQLVNIDVADAAPRAVQQTMMDEAIESTAQAMQSWVKRY